MLKINWSFQDESVQFPNRYKATNIATGEEIIFTLLRDTGTINVIGTPLDETNMNSLINAINENYNDIIALKNRATNIEENISNLQNATTTNTNNISANRNDIDTNANKINNLQATVNAHSQSINNLESTKANKNEMQQALDQKANKDEVQQALDQKADKNEVQQALDQKADKNEVQQALDQKVNKSDIGEIPSIEGLASENYVKNYVNGAIDDFYTNEIDGSYLSTSGGVVNGNITANNYTAKQSVCTKWVQCGGYMQYGTVPATTPTTKGALYFDEAGTIHYFKNAIVEGKTSNNELATVEYVDNKKTYVHHLSITGKSLSTGAMNECLIYLSIPSSSSTPIKTGSELYNQIFSKIYSSNSDYTYYSSYGVPATGIYRKVESETIKKGTIIRVNTVKKGTLKVKYINLETHGIADSDDITVTDIYDMVQV